MTEQIMSTWRDNSASLLITSFYNEIYLVSSKSNYKHVGKYPNCFTMLTRQWVYKVNYANEFYTTIPFLFILPFSF